MSTNTSPITHNSSLLKVGITGQSGFVGTHLYNFLGLKENIERIPFKDKFFDTTKILQEFVSKCDVIVHLAGMNRHKNPEEIYKINLELVDKLINAMKRTGSTPHVVFSSSTQEERDNLYGRSKKEGRELFIDWAEKNNAIFTGMIIPNVFGPFGDPHYNSVVATFCHQLTHNEQPTIEVDGQLKLIYINELIEKFYHAIQNMAKNHAYIIEHTSEKKVSELLAILTNYKELYFQKGIFPNLDNPFKLNLFNTFVCYMNLKEYFPFNLKKNEDERGIFVESVKLNSGGQVSFSTTKPGITRGNHFHIRKAERFAVIKGNARIQLRKIGSNEILNFKLDGNQPSYVDIPIWYSHNIKNIGDEDLFTIFWISEQYDPENPDTYYEEV